MTYRVIVRPAGEEDLAAAVDCYELRAPEQVDRFIIDVEDALRRAGQGRIREHRTVCTGITVVEYPLGLSGGPTKLLKRVQQLANAA